ncbi:MAG: hypothetical protein EOM76_13155, partial [Sphingobacteriia bacterium]|nr:hypothetical protein [Sphingobacteriia bacterium]
MSKVILLLVDGMRPDALEMCKNPFLDKLKKNSLYTQKAKTVMPTVTLPCHFSLFHSVHPERHGILSNLYTPQVRPIEGLCEVIKRSGKTAAFFYNWEELRDLYRPGSLAYSNFINLHNDIDSDKSLTNNALEFLKSKQPDFIFLYLGETDSQGHKTG